MAGRGQFGEYVGRCAGPLEGVDRKTAVSLLESPGAVDAFVDHFLRCRPPAGELFRCVAAGGTVFFQSGHQSVEAVGATAGARDDIGISLHLHHALRVPFRAVAGRPCGIGGQVGGECHQCPGRLLAGTDVGLRLCEQIVHAECLLPDYELRVARNTVPSALRQVAQPLIGMALACVAAFLQQGDDTRRSCSEVPAGEPTAVEQVVESSRIGAVVSEREFLAKCQNAVNHLPGTVHRGIQPAVIAGVGQHRVDSLTELSPVDWGGLGIASVRPVARRAAGGRLPAACKQANQQSGRGQRPGKSPVKSAANSRSGNCVEECHGQCRRCGEGEGSAGR